MMTADSNTTGDTFQQALRLELAIATRFGETTADFRARIARLRHPEAMRDADEILDRFEHERLDMHTQLSAVNDDAWWDTATPADIAGVYETALAWHDNDEVANITAVRIADRVCTRFGLDVTNLGAGPKEVGTAVHDATWDRDDNATNRFRAGLERTATQMLVALATIYQDEAQRWERFDWSTEDYDGADIADHSEFTARYNDWIQAGLPSSFPGNQQSVIDSTDGSEPAADSATYEDAARRRHFADHLDTLGIPPRTIAARLLADGENATHPSNAITPYADSASVRAVAKTQYPRENRAL